MILVLSDKWPKGNYAYPCAPSTCICFHRIFLQVFLKALYYDNVITSSDIKNILSHLSDTEENLLDLKKLEAFLPEPYSSLFFELRKYFWGEIFLDKNLYAVVRGFENTSIVSLLSLLTKTSKIEGVVVDYYSFNSSLFKEVSRVLEDHGFNVLLISPKYFWELQGYHFNEIWIGPGADTYSLRRVFNLEKIKPGIKLRLENGSWKIESLHTEFGDKPKPEKPIVEKPKEINYLEIIFEEDRVPRVAVLLSELVKSSSLTEKNVFDIMRELGLSLRDYYRLLKYGFIETVSAPGGRNICPSLKTMRIYHIVEFYAKKYVEEEGRE